MRARIYKPDKSAMQSGRAKTAQWVLEYELETERAPEALMGWTASGDTLNQVRLKFDSLQDAQGFADKKGLIYTVQTAHDRKIRPRNYGDNFRYDPEDEQ